MANVYDKATNVRNKSYKNMSDNVKSAFVNMSIY